MTVNIIAAVALDGAIGRNNDLLWHLSADLKYFKATTMGHPVIMGRRTFESIGRPLPGRRNIVISRSDELTLPEGVELVHSFEEAISLFEGIELPDSASPFVIGGGQIYAQAMEYAAAHAECDARIYVTRVFVSAPKADTFFPPIEADFWDIKDQSDIETDEKSGIQYRFETYTKA